MLTLRIETSIEYGLLLCEILLLMMIHLILIVYDWTKLVSSHDLISHWSRIVWMTMLPRMYKLRLLRKILNVLHSVGSCEYLRLHWCAHIGVPSLMQNLRWMRRHSSIVWLSSHYISLRSHTSSSYHKLLLILMKDLLLMLLLLHKL